MKKLIRVLLNRVKEGSSWRGAIAVLMAYYLKISPEHALEILSTGLTASGVIGILVPEKKNE